MPTRHSLPILRDGIVACRGCPLYRDATQAVFGEGPKSARIVIVGEQPGDAEDREGHPFVGPAGRLLDQALEAASIARDEVYVTNAVKHFKFTRRGKRRIHDKPTRYEVRACRPWLLAELDAIKPAIIVVLGATAAQSLLGNTFRVTQSRGEPLETTSLHSVGGLARWVFATVHPAAVLRAPDHDARLLARRAFFADFVRVGEHLRAL